jgi:DNA polymerase-3 subunit delta
LTWSPAPLDKQIQGGGSLAPVYLLAGDEHLLLLEALDRVRAAARTQGFSEREVLDADKDFDWNRLAQSAAAMSLFATRRVIELRLPTGRPGNEGAAAIVEYCKSPPPDDLLLISAPTWSKSHETSWVAEVERVGAVVVFWPLQRHELGPWLSARAQSRGLSLGRDALDMQVERTEGHLLAAAQEIDQTALLLRAQAPGKSGSGKPVPVDVATLREAVADHARYDVFALAEAMLAGEPERASRVLQVLRAEGEAVAALVPWLASQTQLACGIAAAVARGEPVDSALRRANVWQSRMAQFKSAARRGDAKFWEARYGELARIERLSKGREQGDAWIALERMVVAAADPRAARAFAA